MRTKPTVEEVAKDIVGREVLMCGSSLIGDLLSISTYELSRSICGVDWYEVENLQITEEDAIDSGYSSLDEALESGEGEHTIYEWWFVSEWLYSKLRERGEPVLAYDAGYLWGRTCTGQALHCDSVFVDIAETILVDR